MGKSFPPGKELGGGHRFLNQNHFFPRVSYQVDVRSRESSEFYTRHHDAQTDRAAVRAEIEVLRRERLAYEQESIQTRQDLARSEAHCRALEARVTVLETDARRHEWQRQAADDLAVQYIMRTQALEAGARVDTLEDTGLVFSCDEKWHQKEPRDQPRPTVKGTYVVATATISATSFDGLCSRCSLEEAERERKRNDDFSKNNQDNRIEAEHRPGLQCRQQARPSARAMWIRPPMPLTTANNNNNNRNNKTTTTATKQQQLISKAMVALDRWYYAVGNAGFVATALVTCLLSSPYTLDHGYNVELADGSEDFIAYCDASKKGLGAVLMQREKSFKQDTDEKTTAKSSSIGYALLEVLENKVGATADGTLTSMAEAGFTLFMAVCGLLTLLAYKFGYEYWRTFTTDGAKREDHFKLSRIMLRACAIDFGKGWHRLDEKLMVEEKLDPLVKVRWELNESVLSTRGSREGPILEEISTHLFAKNTPVVKCCIAEHLGQGSL
ncbi:hypothetical protein Tco_0057864 [Tanacetum coccineum]